MSFKFGPNQKKWLRLLESGKYRRTTGRLCRVSKNGNKSYCCLGLAAEKVISLESEIVSSKTFGEKDYLNFHDNNPTDVFGDAAGLPGISFKELGLNSRIGTFMKDGDYYSYYKGEMIQTLVNPSLARLNDIGYTFKQIARIIRKFPKYVFNKSV